MGAGFVDAVERMVHAVFDWDRIAQVARVFGGGWTAVVGLGIVIIPAASIIVVFMILVYLGLKSRNSTRVQIEKLKKRRGE